MRITKIYKYQGDNGVITSPIKIEGVECKEKLRLGAEGKNILTNGDKRIRMVEIDVEDKELWQEVPATEEDFKNRVVINRPEQVNYKELLDIVTGEGGEE